VNRRLTRKCQVLGLYLAARGSDGVWEFLINPQNIGAAARKWKALGVGRSVIQEVAAYIRKERRRKPVNKPNPDKYDPDPCPYPPCTAYVGGIIEVITRNVAVQGETPR